MKISRVLFFITILVFLTSASQAHILVIGDSQGDLPDFYQEAKQLAADLKSQGYPVLELYKDNATTKNILKGMYDADAVIYVGHGGYQSGHYDLNGGPAIPPFALVGSDDFIWSIGNQMREGEYSPLFEAPFKSGIPVFLLHTCFSIGWVEDKEVANPIETIYNFAGMFIGAGANYYATAWFGAEIIYDFLNGAADFQDANNQNHEVIMTATPYNGVDVWKNTGGYAAFVGDWNGVFPSVNQTTTYDDAAAEAWYYSNRLKNKLTCTFSISPGPYSVTQPVTFTEESYDLGGVILNYIWDFGDGTSFTCSTAYNLTHIYSIPGNYEVIHTVNNSQNFTSQSNKTISILGVESVRYVNAFSGNESWDGTSPTWINGTIGPLKTITSAVNAINEGGTINVAEGNYTENLMINKTLNLIGENIKTHITSETADTSVISIKNTFNCIIQGFSLSKGSYGISLHNATNCSIEGNNLTDNNFAAVYLYDSPNCTISYNTISNNPYGVFGEYGDRIQIKNNTITDNSYSGAVLRYWSDDNQIINNTFTGNGFGLHLLYSSGNAIMQNKMDKNTFYGIYMDNSQNNKLYNNSITSNPYAGVAMYFSANNNTFNNNNLTGNGFGMYLYQSHQNNLTTNNISSNTYYGTYLDNADSNTLELNTIHNNPYAGVAMYFGSNQNHIGTINRGNTIMNNGFGMYLYQSHQNNLITNNISSNTYYGTYLDNSCSNTINGNNLNGNPYAGLALYSSSEANAIYENVLNENGYGIYANQAIGGSTNPGGYIFNNTINNQFYGIFLYNSSRIDIIENNIRNNSYAGIALYNESNNNELHYNNLKDNGFGIYADGCTGNQIYQNNFDTNTAFAYDNGNNRWDNGTDTGNYYTDWPTNTQRDIPGGSNTDHYPQTAAF